MRLASRHLATDFARFFLTSSAAFLALFWVVTFFEKLKVFLKYKANAADALLFMAARAPWMVCQTAPMAVLVATLLSVTLFSRHGEITALRCGGVPLRRLVFPYVVCGLLVSLGSVLLQEFVVPGAAAFSREVEELRIRKNPSSALVRAGNLWLRLGDRIVHVEKVDPERNELTAVSAIEVRNGAIARRVEAQQARWTGDRWVLRDAEFRTFSASGGVSVERFASVAYPLSESPSDFRVAVFDVEEMPLTRLGRLVTRYRRQGLDSRDLEVGLWGKTSLPFASLVMPLLAFPCALRRGRQEGASLGIALGVAIGFVYWLTLASGLSLGKAGSVPIPLGAWAGNLLFGAVGLALLWKAERV